MPTLYSIDFPMSRLSRDFFTKMRASCLLRHVFFAFFRAPCTGGSSTPRSPPPFYASAPVLLHVSARTDSPSLFFCPSVCAPPGAPTAPRTSPRPDKSSRVPSGRVRPHRPYIIMRATPPACAGPAQTRRRKNLFFPLDKPEDTAYNVPVILRQQVPGKSVAFLPRWHPNMR